MTKGAQGAPFNVAKMGEIWYNILKSSTDKIIRGVLCIFLKR